MTTHRRRGVSPSIRPIRPDGPPKCPGCGRTMTLSQPAGDRPDELFGSCDNPPCGEWVILIRRERPLR